MRAGPLRGATPFQRGAGLNSRGRKEQGKRPEGSNCRLEEGMEERRWRGEKREAPGGKAGPSDAPAAADQSKGAAAVRHFEEHAEALIYAGQSAKGSSSCGIPSCSAQMYCRQLSSCNTLTSLLPSPASLALPHPSSRSTPPNSSIHPPPPPPI
eukprot:2349155-Rhodomonas_salina.2